MSKRFSKYIASFNHFVIVLSVTTGSISTASFATVIGAPLGIISAHFSIVFLISTGIVKKLFKQQKIKIKSTIKLSARSKLNSIESKISEALITKLVTKTL